MKTTVIGTALTALVACGAAEAQWRQFPDPSIPRTATGEPDLDAEPPRARRKPSLAGVWLPDSEPPPEGLELVEGDLLLPRYFINITADLPPDEVPIQGWAADLFEQRLASNGTLSPMAYCQPTGVPILNSAPLPFKIVQTPELVVILYEENTVFRQIFLDGREPVEDPLPRWMGYSTGRWEGDSLVVETVGFSRGHWLDGMGHPASEQLRMIERFRRPTAGRLEIETTIDDPGAYTKPITFTVKATAVANEDLLEYFCSENEKDVEHYE